jgi:hypothetical protein
MFMLKRILTLLILFTLSLTSLAQDEDAPRSFAGYYLADDENGALQVWRLSEDGTSSEMLTNMPNDIADFDVSEDETQIAYTSNQTLWLQQLDSSASNEIAVLEPDEVSSPAYPVFSPDGSMLAYNNGGLTIYSASSGESRLILEDVPYTEGMESVDPVRFYVPFQFVDDKLIVSVRFWEGSGFGVLDIETEVFQEQSPVTHTRLLPLSDGRVLLYGNSEIYGDYNLEIAPSLDDINTREIMLDLETLSPSDTSPLYIDEAVEIEPGIVRVMGSSFVFATRESPYLYFDLNIETVEVVSDGLVEFPLIEADENRQSWLHTLSPDGVLIAQYRNLDVRTDLNSNGTLFGELVFYDLEVGEFFTPELEGEVGAFQWSSPE